MERDGSKLGGGETGEGAGMGVGGGGGGGGMGRGASMAMGVYGHEVGGSLALMLGMTECDPGVDANLQHSVHDHPDAAGRANIGTGKPHIRAVAVHNPIVDWVFPQAELDPETRPSLPPSSPPVSPPPTSAATPANANLIALRARAFRSNTHPPSYFDPFASPIHFLRTPSAAIPPASMPDNSTSSPTRETSGSGSAIAANDEFDVLARLEEETLSALRPSLISETGQTQTQMLSEMPVASKPQSGITEETLYIDTTVRRKVPLRWPPSSMPVSARMPWFRITVSEDDGEHGDSEKSREQEATKSKKSTTIMPLDPIQQQGKTKTQANPLLTQGTEMARLLRRAYVKYCLPRELGRQDQLDTEAETADIRSLVRAGDKIVEERVLRDIMAPDTDELPTNANSKASGRSGRTRKRKIPREQEDGQERERGEQEEEEEKTLRTRISSVRRLAREKVGFEILPAYRDRERLDGEEGDIEGREHAWAEAIDTEEAIEEMEMDDLEEVGRWMGGVLRR